MEARPDHVERYVAAVFQVVADRLQHSRNQARHEQVEARVLGRGRDGDGAGLDGRAAAGLGGRERIEEDLRQAARVRQGLPRLPPGDALRLLGNGLEVAAQGFGLDLVVAVNAPDLLRDVLGPRDVAAGPPAGNRNLQRRVLAAFHAEPQTQEDALRALIGELGAQASRQPARRNGDAAWRGRRRAHVAGTADPMHAGAHVFEQLDEAHRSVGNALGIEPLLEADGGLRAQAELLRGAADTGHVEIGHLQDDLRRVVLDLGILQAHHARDRDRTLRVRDHTGALDRKLPLDAVQRDHLLARERLAHDDVAVGDLPPVEGMQRLAVLQQDVVRQVDDVVDRALTRQLQPPPQPVGGGAHLDAGEHPPQVARAQVRRVDRDAHAGLRVLGQLGAYVAEIGRAQLTLQDRGQLARGAVVPPQVGPRGDGRVVDVQHRAAGQHVARRRTHFERRVQHEDAFVLVAQPELALGQHHAAALDAADLAPLEHGSVGQRRPLGGEADLLALGHVGRAADDFRLTVAVVHPDQPQLVGVRVGAHVEHAPHTDARPAAARLAHLVHGRDVRREQLPDLAGGQVAQIHEVVQPLHAEEHQNCSRKRRSPRWNQRMSSMP